MSTETDAYIANPQQLRLDLQMAAYDLWGTRAHVTMLASISVLSNEELDNLNAALDAIQAEIDAGRYAIDPSLGAHLTLEHQITQRVGEQIGGKVHTGRSRNDQVITAQRLYLRERLLDVHADLLALLEGLLTLAEKHVETVMPGYTHMQPAKPTSVAQWTLAYHDMLARDSERFSQTFARLNISPLGAAESYGTAWPIDRAMTARLLGFDSVQEVPPDVVSSRGEIEAEILSGLSFVALHLSKLAQDLLLFTTHEYRYVTLGEDVAQRMGKLTGSSIMPQKRNPDVLELARADASALFSALLHTFEVLKALPIGYNRDSRETKESVINGLDRAQSTLRQMRSVLASLHFDTARMHRAVIDNYSLATDLADYLAQTFDVPYRSVYQVVGETVTRAIEHGLPLEEAGDILLEEVGKKNLTNIIIEPAALPEILSPQACLARRTHIGGAAPLETRRLISERRARLEEARQTLNATSQRVAREEVHQP